MTARDADARTDPSDAADDVLNALRSSAGGVLLMSHVRADGDAWGSLLGLAHLLRDAGHTTHVVAGEPMPTRYAGLPGANGRIPPDRVPDAGEAPTVVVVDTPSAARVTPGASPLLDGRRVIQIDHHGAGHRFGDVLWIDPAAAATAVMVWRLAVRAGWQVSAAAADCLYAGVIADTGGFRYGNTDAAALEAAAGLAALGADAARWGFEILDRKSRAAVELRQTATRRAQWRMDDALVGAWIGPDDYVRAAAGAEDLEGLVEFLRSVNGVRVAILVDRAPDDTTTHISWRTDRFDAIPLARARGGGGHRGAAGAETEGSPPTILEEVMADAESAIRRVRTETPRTPS